MEEELISVIMSTYNEKEEWIINSINSILNQTYSNLEIIITQDNPDNLNLTYLLREYQKKDSRIKLIINQQNIGLVSSLNNALKICNGNYVARMDADDIADIKRIEEEFKYLKKNNYDIIGCEVQTINEFGNVINPKAFKYRSDKSIKKYIKFASPLAHPTWLVKKEVYTKLCGYRNITSCEDYDFLIRAFNSGYKIGICKGVFLSYRINKNSISHSNLLKQSLSANFLHQNFKSIDDISQVDLDHYLESNLSNDDMKRFNKCCLNVEKSKNIITIIKSCFYSKFYFKYVLRKIRICLIDILQR